MRKVGQSSLKNYVTSGANDTDKKDIISKQKIHERIKKATNKFSRVKVMI